MNRPLAIPAKVALATAKTMCHEQRSSRTRLPPSVSRLFQRKICATSSGPQEPGCLPLFLVCFPILWCVAVGVRVCFVDCLCLCVVVRMSLLVFPLSGMCVSSFSVFFFNVFNCVPFLFLVVFVVCYFVLFFFFCLFW